MDESIEKNRDVALGLLKPSAAELEHGLELHKNALVFESYGFSPRFANDGDALRAAVEAGATQVEIEDMIEDMGMTRGATNADELKYFLDAWQAAGVDCIFQNAGQEGMEIGRIIKRLAHFTFLTDMISEHVSKAVRPDDIVAAKEAGRRSLYFSLNGVPLPLDFICVEEELRYIKIFFQLGARMAHLTYNRRNLIGDGCGEPANGGLSDFGLAVVAEMNRVGMIVDVAHSGWQTSLDAAKASKLPMCASHSVCCGLHEHCRGKHDDVIRAIADTGGFIGICCVPAFLGDTGDIRAFLDHIDYAVKTFGADHVAIGTDVGYSPPHFWPERDKIPERRKLRPPWRSLWPEDCGLGDPQWSKPEQRDSMAWTNWPIFTVGMVQRGHSDDDIRKILGGNVLRVARDNFNASF